MDIIKSGGCKLSVLEIEAALPQHPAIREGAVIGATDDTWEEAVAAAEALNDGASLDLETLRQWFRDRLAVYKIPKRLKVMDGLPRNAVGKITKPDLSDLF